VRAAGRLVHRLTRVRPGTGERLGLAETQAAQGQATQDEAAENEATKGKSPEDQLAEVDVSTEGWPGPMLPTPVPDPPPADVVRRRAWMRRPRKAVKPGAIRPGVSSPAAPRPL
jgi:hypothetical protein